MTATVPTLDETTRAETSLLTAAIVVPCLNEEDVIADLVAELRAVAGRPDLPVRVAGIYVVDNGSTDATGVRAAAAGATIVPEPRRGYGRACLSGALATGEVDLLVFMDGDRSDRPEDLPLLLAPILSGEADLVIGSRTLGRAEPGALTASQRLGNWLATRLLRFLYGVRVTDVGPFRVIRLRDLLALGMAEMTYGWPVEMIVKAARQGARIVELPVSYRPRSAGASKVGGTVRGTILASYRILHTTFRYALGGIAQQRRLRT
jgi:glycosyltransferase involved in cell wall biosynthesis